MRAKEIESIIAEWPELSDYEFIPVKGHDFILPRLEDDVSYYPKNEVNEIKESNLSTVNITLDRRTMNRVHFGFNILNEIVVYRKLQAS